MKKIFALALASLMLAVSVSAGIHVDNAALDELEKLWNNSVECCSRLLGELRAKESI